MAAEAEAEVVAVAAEAKAKAKAVAAEAKAKAVLVIKAVAVVKAAAVVKAQDWLGAKVEDMVKVRDLRVAEAEAVVRMSAGAQVGEVVIVLGKAVAPQALMGVVVAAAVEVLVAEVA